MTQVLFDGDVVLVTGAARGLGRAHANLLAARGARIVVNDTGGVVDGTGGDLKAAERTASEIEQAGGIALPDTNDCSDPTGAARLVDAAISEYGRVDAIVANAGIIRDRSFHKMTDEDFVAVVTVHLFGTMRVVHAAWPHFREQGYGRVVTTTSASGLYGNFGQANYGAAKLGIVGLSKTLALEGRAKNIKANAIAPIASTRMSEDVMGELGPKAPPALVSPLVAYLANRVCTPTGQVFSVGAGRVAHGITGVADAVSFDEITPEGIEASMGDILRPVAGLLVPSEANDEMAMFNR